MLKTRKWQELYLFVKNVFSYYIIYEILFPSKLLRDGYRDR